MPSGVLCNKCRDLTSGRAFDLEKRQHLFHHRVLKPLPPNMVGLWGTGSIHDVNVDIQAAEAEIERKWAEGIVREREGVEK